MEKLLRNFFQGQVDRKETSLETRFSWAFSIYKKKRKISIGNSHLGRVGSICHKSHSFTGPSMPLRCL